MQSCSHIACKLFWSEKAIQSLVHNWLMLIKKQEITVGLSVKFSGRKLKWMRNSVGETFVLSVINPWIVVQMNTSEVILFIDPSLWKVHQICQTKIRKCEIKQESILLLDILKDKKKKSSMWMNLLFFHWTVLEISQFLQQFVEESSFSFLKNVFDEDWSSDEWRWLLIDTRYVDWNYIGDLSRSRDSLIVDQLD